MTELGCHRPPSRLTNPLAFSSSAMRLCDIFWAAKGRTIVASDRAKTVASSRCAWASCLPLTPSSTPRVFGGPRFLARRFLDHEASAGIGRQVELGFAPAEEAQDGVPVFDGRRRLDAPRRVVCKPLLKGLRLALKAYPKPSQIIPELPHPGLVHEGQPSVSA